MTYEIEVQRYGRKETQIDVARFAADLAKLLGSKVEPRDPDRSIDGNIDHISVGKLRLSVHANHYGCKGKVNISAMVADIPPDDRPYHDGRGTYKLPDVHVSASRPMERIAKDVKRRVIDAAAAPLAAIEGYGAKRSAARDQMGEVCKQLAAAVPEMRERANGRGSSDDPHSRTFDWSGLSHVYLTARAYNDGQVGIDRIGNVSLAAFIEIADVLRRHARKEI